MRVYENIERFHRKSPRYSTTTTISDEVMRVGLKSIIDAVIPYRKYKEEIITKYLKARDEHPLTAALGEGIFGPEPEIGRKEVDFAILEVIFEDRYSFGYLYWHLFSQFEKHEVYKFYDPEAPFKKGLIEYAIVFDLEDTVNHFHGLSDLEERYKYALSMLHRSQQEVLVSHPIKVEYESKLSILIEKSQEESSKTNHTHLGAETDDELDSSVPQEARDRNPSDTNKNVFANNYVRDINNRKRLMRYLHEQLQDKTNQFALVYIQAAINAGLLSFPSWSDLINEFGPICTKANYHKLVKVLGGGGFKRLSQDVEVITTELKERFK